MEGAMKAAANYIGIAPTRPPPVNTEFSDNDVYETRKRFNRKIYTILTLQLVITASIITFVLLYEPAKTCITNVYFRWTLYGTTAILLIPNLGIPKLRRIPKLNLILLMLFTITASIVLAEVSCYFETNALFVAIGVTMALFIGLTLFSLLVKWDFTKIPVYICVLQSNLLVLLLVVIYVRSNIFTNIFSSYGILVLSLSLVYDSQLVQVRRRKYSYLLNEYTLAALSLYIEMYIICVFLLQLI